MRTISSLVSVFLLVCSSAALAGDKSICDEDPSGGGLWDKKSLQKLGAYGLCVAYQNADEEDKPALAEQFFIKAGFDVPGSEPSEACPCWNELELLHARCNYELTDDGTVFSQFFPEGGYASFDGGFITFTVCAPGVAYENCSFPLNPPSCSYTKGVEFTESTLTADEYAFCLASIDYVISEDSLADCP